MIYSTKIVNGKLFMICENSVQDGKYWRGEICDSYVQVTTDTKSALCSKCTSLVVAPPKLHEPPSGKPRGWAFMRCYVHNDGKVYHKGIEQPDLFGTLPVTILKQEDEETCII